MKNRRMDGLSIPPRTFAPEKIIELLSINKNMTFTQLQKSLKLSRPALSRHLAKLMYYETIECEKKGREKHYKINKKNVAMKAKNTYLVMNYVVSIFGSIENYAEDDTFDKIYENIEKRLGSYFIFLILHSLKTGENWYESFDHRKIGLAVFDYLMSIVLEKKKANLSLFNYVSKDELDAIYVSMNKEIIYQKKKTRLNEMVKALKKRHPNDTEWLKTVFSDMNLMG